MLRIHWIFNPGDYLAPGVLNLVVGFFTKSTTLLGGLVGFMY